MQRDGRVRAAVALEAAGELGRQVLRLGSRAAVARGEQPTSGDEPPGDVVRPLGDVVPVVDEGGDHGDRRRDVVDDDAGAVGDGAVLEPGLLVDGHRAVLSVGCAARVTRPAWVVRERPAAGPVVLADEVAPASRRS